MKATTVTALFTSFILVEIVTNLDQLIGGAESLDLVGLLVD